MNLKRLANRAAVSALGVSLMFMIGPRNPDAALEPPVAHTPPPQALEELDAHLAQREAALGNVTPGTEKRVVWGAAGKRRAPWAVVFLHGFSASRQELAPLPEQVAQGLGGHVFYTRLAGHGQPGEALGRATVAEWKADALEALAIGQLLGEQVLVMGNSTGATLATWLAEQEASGLRPEGASAHKVAAYVMVSPNFAPKDPWAQVINWPWGRQLARLVQGPERRYEPSSELKARYWTHRYPTEALFPMMALVDHVQRSQLEWIHSPVLMMLSPRDTVISVDAAYKAFRRFASPHKQLIEVNYSQSLGQHVLAGDIEDPKATPQMAAQILAYVRGLP